MDDYLFVRVLEGSHPAANMKRLGIMDRPVNSVHFLFVSLWAITSSLQR